MGQRNKQSRPVASVERLDLTDKKANWELLLIATNSQPEKPLADVFRGVEAKGCFVTFGLHEVDKNQFEGVIGQGVLSMEDLTNIKRDQVMSETVDDKYMFFGGWRPYVNVSEIDVATTPGILNTEDSID